MEGVAASAAGLEGLRALETDLADAYAATELAPRVAAVAAICHLSTLSHADGTSSLKTEKSTAAGAKWPRRLGVVDARLARRLHIGIT